MERNKRLDSWIIGTVPLGRMYDLPEDKQGKSWRDRIRQSAKRMGVRVHFIRDNGRYYIIRANDAPQHN